MLSSLGTGVVLALCYLMCIGYWNKKNMTAMMMRIILTITLIQHCSRHCSLSPSVPIGSSGQVPPLSPLTGRKSSQDTDKLHTWGGVEEEEGGWSAQASITRHHRLGGPKRQKLILWQFWRLEVQDQGITGMLSSEASLLGSQVATFSLQLRWSWSPP